MTNPSLQFDRDIGAEFVRQIGGELGSIGRLALIGDFDRDVATVDTGQVERFLQPGTPLLQAYARGWLDRPAAGYTPGALLAHRRLFDLVGRFDESLTVGCDSEWFTRLLDSGVVFDMLPEVVLWKRIHAANLSSAVERYRRELLIITRRSLQRRGYL